MFKNNTKYNKVYRNGILYSKGFRNGQQILGNSVDPSLLIDIPFNGDFENKVVGGIQMEVAGGAPTFSNGAAVFNGSQSIKTVTPLDIGTDKVTVCFWIKTTQTDYGVITEYSENSYNNGGFMILAGNNFTIFDSKSQENNEKTVSLNLSNLEHIAITIDRNLSTNESLKLFKNGVQMTLNSYSNADINGVFSAERLFIGQRNSNELPFIGSLQKFQLYNRVLTQQEIQDLMV